MCPHPCYVLAHALGAFCDRDAECDGDVSDVCPGACHFVDVVVRGGSDAVWRHGAVFILLRPCWRTGGVDAGLCVVEAEEAAYVFGDWRGVVPYGAYAWEDEAAVVVYG